MNNIIIIVPILNEKENIDILFNKLTATNIVFDLLFIDDNSKDNSFYNIVRYRSFLDEVFPDKRSGRPRKSLESTVKKE